MAKITFKQLRSNLTKPSQDIVSGDTIENKTTGVLTVVIGVENTVGKATIVEEKEGSEITILPGATSAVVTFGAGEGVYFKDVEGSMRSTVDKLV